MSYIYILSICTKYQDHIGAGDTSLNFTWYGIGKEISGIARHYSAVVFFFLPYFDEVRGVEE